jgi:hypothetical protein
VRFFFALLLFCVVLRCVVVVLRCVGLFSILLLLLWVCCSLLLTLCTLHPHLHPNLHPHFHLHPRPQLNYMAPEAISPAEVNDDDEPVDAAKKMRLGRASDVWSLGCILYQMVYGRPPYSALSTVQKLSAIPKPEYKVRGFVLRVL